MQALCSSKDPQPSPTRARGNKAMTDCFEPIIFTRHQRQLRALLLENQAWFCLQDIARLMGKPLDERATWKLDADQRRTAWLDANGQCSKQLLISESGLFTLLVHHYVPEIERCDTGSRMSYYRRCTTRPNPTCPTLER